MVACKLVRIVGTIKDNIEIEFRLFGTKRYLIYTDH
jgi:hypothetical protein